MNPIPLRHHTKHWLQVIGVVILMSTSLPASVQAQTLPPPLYIHDARFDVKPTSAGTQLKYAAPFGAVRQTDGKHIVLGSSCPTGPYATCANIVLARYDVAGQLDPTFGQNGITQFDDLALTRPAFIAVQQASGSERVGLALQHSGKILVGLRGGAYGSTLALARFSPDGTPDASFGVSGIVTNTALFWPRSLALQADGAIVLAGVMSGSASYTYTSTLARYRPTGELDTRFGVNGVVTQTPTPSTNTFAGLEIQPDGRLLTYGPLGGELLRFMPNGAPDLAFGAQGRYLATTPIYDAQVTPDHHIILASQTYTRTEVVLTALDSNGHIAPAFGSSGVFTYTPAPVENGITRFCYDVSLTLQDHQILIYGKTFIFTGGQGYYCLSGLIARVTEAGQLDTTFGLSGTLTTPYRRDGNNIAVNAQGLFLVEDVWTTAWDGNPRLIYYTGLTRLWRYEPNGNPESKARIWGIDVWKNGAAGLSKYGLDGYINGIALDSKSRILAAHTAVDPDKNPNLYEQYARVNLTRLALASDFTRLPVVMR